MPSRKQLEEDIRTMGYKEIASKYCVSPATAGRWLKRYNLHRTRNNAEKNEEERSGVEISAEIETAAETGIIKREPVDYAEQAESFRRRMDSVIAGQLILVGVMVYIPESKWISGQQNIPDACQTVEDVISYYMAMHMTTADVSISIFNTAGRYYYLVCAGADKKELIGAMKDISADLMHRHGIQIFFDVQKGINYRTTEELYKDVARTLTCREKKYRWQTENNSSYMADTYSDTHTDLSAPIRIPDGIEENINDVPDAAAETPDQERKETETEDLREEVPQTAPVVPSDCHPEPTDIYLVDSENVSASWAQLLDGDPGKQFIILYTDNTPKISYGDMAAVMASSSSIRFRQVYTGEKGASALDFQLVSLLGYMLCADPERNYTIVSRDAGYDPVVRMWKDRGYSVKRFSMVNRALPEGTKAYSQLTEAEKQAVSEGCRNALEEDFRKPSPAKHKKMTDPLGDSDGKRLDRIMYLQKHIPGRKKEIYEDIMSILNSSEAEDLGHIHADFIDVFGGSQGERLFALTRKKIKGYKAI